MQYGVKIDIVPAMAYLEKVKKSLDPAVLLVEVDRSVRLSYLDEVFDTGGFGKWPKTHRGGTVLHDTGTMRKAFVRSITGNVLTISNPTKYFVTHELGLTLTPNGKYLAIPLSTLPKAMKGTWPREHKGKTINVGKRTVPLTSCHEAKNGKLFIWMRTGRIKTVGKLKILDEVPIYKLVTEVKIPERSMLSHTPEMDQYIEDGVTAYLDEVCSE